MKNFKPLALAYLILLLMKISTAGAAVVPPKIAYKVTFPEAQAHYADIEMTVSGLKQPTLDLKMPVWTPGSYLVREFAKNIESLTATANGKAVAAPKTSKNTWHINTTGISTVVVKYKVYSFEVSVRTSFVDITHGFLSTTVCFYILKGC
jgi:predicted metalloprotease with PDZ domain